MAKRAKQNKKLITILAIISVIFVVAIGGILAFLTDTDSKTNTFTIGSIDIDLVESAWDNAADTNNNGVPDFAEGIVPGQTINKDPKIQNIGANDAYVYAKVYVPLVTVPAKYIDGTHTAGTEYENVELFSYTVNPGWTQTHVGHTDDGKYNIYIYKYDTVLGTTAGSNETATLFDTVTVANMDADTETINSIINTITSENTEGADVVTVKVEAYAIQKDGGINQASNEIVTAMTTVTGETIGAKINEKVAITPANYGQKVNYSVDVNGVTLNDWEIFLKDGNNVYMIYGDYMPNAAIPQAAITAGNLETDETYSVWNTTNRTDLITSLTTEVITSS